MDRRKLRNIVTVLEIRMRGMRAGNVVYVEAVDDRSGAKLVSGTVSNNKFTADFMSNTKQAASAYKILLNNLPILVREAV